MTERQKLLRDIQMELRAVGAGLSTLNGLVGSHLDLRGQDLAVLDLLARSNGMAPGHIAENTAIHPATLTGVLDRLEAGGWIARVPDPDDRRKSIVRPVTGRARELVALYRPMNDALRAIGDTYSDEQLAVIVRFLREVSAATGSSKAALGRPS